MKGFTIAVLPMVCLLAAVPLWAQFQSAEVLGTVRDASGSPVPKATVTLTNADTGIEAKTSTNNNGEYDFFDVKIGRYTITVEATGFSKASAEGVQVTVGARQRVDISLQVGVVTESVTVTSAASALETDNSSHRTASQRAKLRRLGAVIGGCSEVPNRRRVCPRRYTARGRLQRERHAQHI
jgi:hypothetical protein